ncbi:16S rRNA (guanine(966)-N(2))-methyltransferase RsmD [Ferroacidibacillus organovorans]|uniref:16S rRNA (Guanine(966)-N(2))-methyltransferase RsmD n=1 Tax=Ferroacidibacillus organovorans TaxID=1765683 RepID=A0A1V4EU38_9BACL|nr:16S rRNA (guanine(966)-N(2))-methyltransferase RsmD [Ferroacidibacillus organovorans]OPG16168.1 16S rRNA (guanine(966)-N(2))-methyltransferase RsmD [Ferroacidibacillus organovorans]
MRVIAGTKRGRTLIAPKGDETRPTLDRVKEALFSRIGPYFDGGMGLDLFAGSGALGIEGISRGLEKVIFVDARTGSVIRDNLARLDCDSQADVWTMDYLRALHRLTRECVKIDVAFLDPPYALWHRAPLLDQLSDASILREEATVVAEMGRDKDTPMAHGYELLRESLYGETKLCVYRYCGTDDFFVEDTIDSQLER